MPATGASSERELLEVGRIVKPHGLGGEVVVSMISDRPERLEPGSVLETDRGPMRVLSSRPHQDRHLVNFDGITSREQAESVRGLQLRAEPLDDPDALWVHELVGCQLDTLDGVSRGHVVAVIENPASDLLELDTGHLVPIVFLKSGPTDGRVVVDTPPGLFDL